MELGQVRYFLGFCRTPNFMQAGEMLNVTRPALSRALLQLEANCGVAKSCRERNLAQLTDLGRTMRAHLRTVLEAGGRRLRSRAGTTQRSRHCSGLASDPPSARPASPARSAV
jgi:DNA-binding transcriptional LysR family regulator